MSSKEQKEESVRINYHNSLRELKEIFDPVMKDSRHFYEMQKYNAPIG